MGTASTDDTAAGIAEALPALDSHDAVKAPDLAAVGAFFEMGDRLGVLPLLGSAGVSAQEVALATGLPVESVTEYLTALGHAGLLERRDGRFHTVPDFELLRYAAGYVSWAANANRPFIEHVREYFEDPVAARTRHARDGRQVAVSSQWMGSFGFYQEALDTIVERRPRHVVDLGAGSARLLIEVLGRVPGSTALALDLSAEACEEARLAARRAGLADRLTVVERSIQSVADDPSVLEGADVVHGGFVFHDMMPEEEAVADLVLANCNRALSHGGIMAITDAVPYVQNERERRFSALVTYYHNRFMGRRLLTEAEWTAKLREAGFAGVESRVLEFPTGRLFVSTKA